MAGRILIRGAKLVGAEGEAASLTVGDVLIEDGKIRAIAPPGLAADNCEVIDASGMIASPGFVDTHRHTWQTQLRGVAADWSLFDYFSQMRSIYSAFYTPEDAYLGNFAGALEAIDAGITTLVDHCHIVNSSEHADEAVRGLVESGIGGVFCYGTFSNPVLPDLAPAGDNAWRRADAERVKKNYFSSDDAVLQMGFAPGEVEAMSVDELVDEIALARSLDARAISCHVSLGAYDPGRQVVADLGRRGVLAPDLLFVHGASLTDEELGMIADTGSAISATPETELQMAMGNPVVTRAQDKAASVSLGVDIVSNFAGDMFAQMRLHLQSERGRRNESLTAPPRSIAPSASEVFELATLGGAKALGMESVIGSLAPGKRADLILTRTDALHMAGVEDPIAALVFYARPTDVDSVLVAGRALKRDGRLVHVDPASLSSSVAASSARIRRAAEKVDKAAIVEIAAQLMLH